MSGQALTCQGRHLLLIDILGLSQLVRTKGSDEILGVINKALEAFNRWERLNGAFKTIYFSDTFLFHQEPQGYGDWAFLDSYAIGSFILTTLLAEGIPARGAISFGSFEVHNDESEKHQVYFGTALVEAHEAEQAENWIGITILPSAWKPYEEKHPGTIAAFQSDKVWLMREADQVLLLNPFIKIRGWHMEDLMGEIDAPYLEWDQPDFPNEIRAFRFLKDTAEKHLADQEPKSRIAQKYLATNSFIKTIFGPELYDWACKISS
ncbi:hypothetical protein [Pseudomonas sp. MBLB4136]|uniref:hypothetical protein n=1 Tax=Pseudomonas sp. MBLB4136 TaxID=3451558 RepID=UPI003F75332E